MRVSVVMPSYNRIDVIEASLRAYDAQIFPHDAFEVIVVDDGSTDGTYERVERVAREVSYPIRLHRQQNRGSGAARNTGTRHARGKIVLFVDDDALPVPGFVAEHARWHETSESLIVRGPIINVPRIEIREREPFVWRHFSMNYFCTANVSVRREQIVRAGFFDERFQRRQDAELGLRLRRLGLKRKFNARAIVYHYKPTQDIEAICRSAVIEGRNSALLFHTHPTWRMMFHMGTYSLNYLQGAIFSNERLVALYKRILNLPVGNRIPILSRILRQFVANHYYLKSAREALTLLRSRSVGDSAGGATP